METQFQPDHWKFLIDCLMFNNQIRVSKSTIKFQRFSGSTQWIIIHLRLYVAYIASSDQLKSSKVHVLSNTTEERLHKSCLYYYVATTC